MSTSAPSSAVLDGAPNFRDLGGIPVAGERRIAFGRVYRSEGLHALSERGVVALGALGIRLVCDLRTSLERDREVSRWPDGGAPELLGPRDRHDGGDEMRAVWGEVLRRALSDPTGERAQRHMRKLYTRMPAEYAEVIGELARRIADDEQIPVVVHCAAGKDRTGFVCSMLLHALGADFDEVVREYVRSDHFFGPERLAAMLGARSGVVAEGPALEAFRTHPHLLELAFESATHEHGSVEAYLEQACGVDGTRRERLREALLEDA